VLGHVLAVASLVWQIISWRLTGSRGQGQDGLYVLKPGHEATWYLDHLEVYDSAVAEHGSHLLLC
jgi:hypothetical protein